MSPILDTIGFTLLYNVITTQRGFLVQINFVFGKLRQGFAARKGRLLICCFRIFRLSIYVCLVPPSEDLSLSIYIYNGCQLHREIPDGSQIRPEPNEIFYKTSLVGSRVFLCLDAA